MAKMRTNLEAKSRGPWPWNQTAKPAVRLRAAAEPIRGHGLGSTKWNGWRSIGIFFLGNLFTWKVNVQLFILRKLTGGIEPWEELQSSA